jgi:prepilin-type N-terminal cleavage/methylation domain-containing protein/prepilin-type processing-associated H-X9-DG protein
VFHFRSFRQHRPQARSTRSGVTLIELLVVISIIGLLVALLLPAVQQAREAARRSKCQNNLRQLGLAIYNYESTYARLPSAGQGTAFTGTGPTTTFGLHSLFSQILPMLEQTNTFHQFDFSVPYNGSPGNISAARQSISTFICPSNAWRPKPTDQQGFGCTDYAAPYYVDLDPATGLPNRSLRRECAMTRCWTRMADVTDGLSSTLFVIEDSGRDERMQPGHVYSDPIDGGLRRFWRWAEPDNAIGISKGINNNKSPKGGPVTCPWTVNNCGPFEEIFSFHSGGAQVLLGDGSVKFLNESLDLVVLRGLATRGEGETISEF